jgi:spore germination protein GerM
LLVAVLLGLALTSCGIPTDSRPRALERSAVPAALAPSTSASTTSTPQGIFTPRAQAFLVKANDDSEVLMPVDVPAPKGDTRAEEARNLIQKLISLQPKQTTATVDLQNDIPSSVRILHARLDGTVLDLDVSNMSNVVLTQQRLAFAQIVYTATGLGGIESVRFSINDRPVQVPLDNSSNPGQPASSNAGQPISRDSYPKLRDAL